MLVLVAVFNCCCVGEGDVYTGLIFTVSKDVDREGICLFEAIVEVSGNNGGEVCFDCMHD